MEPPSYEEASLHPPVLGTQELNTPPPPSYDAYLHSPSTPPPTYGEAVTIQPDHFPVLTPPRVPTAVTSPSENTGVIFHPVTQIGVTPSVSSRQTQTVVVVTQPQPVPISVTCLGDIPGVVCCPHCHHVVTTKVTYLPGGAAWCMCVLLTMLGLVCGFCLIPFMVRGLQDAHHSCPQCGNHLHTHRR
ncbi:lipopolysaccharide-induced tumor necrosis factor-alpha factor homolog isoform X1 [Siniperca chuatsi]|uniref:lipopolysaccharide-induced tumor necrosis factor-alpha factor homolog isoform X1 n=1 Tax=Siniperca chuatsi TaxID=119488 RepID=UPI001CE0B11C|nr:lipopolysaccharide-induced tumor necrosis factor-alpha factor homolog isoform X1 [Siniperca chuatsi]XP_044047543.1 lipopolysaccharide-induced tumor necrosis factor-alpha factor homolog isoform X1 [Siniperca chuatsi]XP_044047544.1 lipopolysaccharide-induced tumor necrosis factor-alpha factor homolog isoform X1 [Siniperca chuatsi]XP_044047545.1 lipopolysaccharide-induced tumor necrosis factor-alpha factor homolog isoform X1 [Siniperca chuatsi]XP_044047546.1 lipopolysaccharide-induced tumor nec